MKITVKRALAEKDLKQAFEIREKVFVKEQQVPSEEEYDGFEKESRHFLAKVGGEAVGTARWRFTENGVKLERFAVLKVARGKGVGSALVKAVLEDVKGQSVSQGKLIYMHAQLDAVPLYEKFGFHKVGDIFTECAIRHYRMERYL